MSNKTSMQKMTAIAMVGVVVAASLVAAAAFAPIAASAQERDEVRDQDHDRRLKVASGAGIATDTGTGDNYRSGVRMMMQYDNSTGERTAVRGAIIISIDDKRVTYTMIPETWDIEMAGDGLTFEASGQVQNRESGVFEASLNGYLGGPVAFIKRVGTAWSVDGEMTGDSLSYDLHYVAITHPIRSAAANR